MTNQLAHERSSYLRQHADNPVDWHPWGAGAFAEARRRNVPVLLSIGYASCHWCHVMAHESFEDEATASQINADFVAVKVDREQRPDVDAIYMTAAQALTGTGGWPLTCFLTPEGEPFYAGTYFPLEPRSGLPSFRQVLTAVTDAWRGDPERVLAAGKRIAGLLRGAEITDGRAGGAPRPPGPTALDDARARVLADADPAHGGFRGAPKFPPPMVLEFLLRNTERTGEVRSLGFVGATLHAMARGGIYDQLGGGFARYSVDEAWRVPHFEKMLTDNALLLRVYARHARLTGAGQSERVAEETGDFLLRDMRSDSGAFVASWDADTEGVEGATYRWTAAQIAAALAGDRDDVADLADDRDGGALVEALAVFGVPGDDMVGEGTALEDDGAVLRRVAEPADAVRFDRTRARLLESRNRRPQPHRDEFETIRGNGLVITALAEAGAAMDRPDWTAAASAAADAMIAACDRGSRWCGGAFRGQPSDSPATLVDYAAFAAGLLALYQATGDRARLDAAVPLLQQMIELFRAPDGTWFDSEGQPADLPPDPAAQADGPMIARPRDPTDGAIPSGMSAAADALLTASALTDRSDFRMLAEEIVGSIGDLAVAHPRATGWHLAVAEALAAGPLQVAVAGPAGPERDRLAAAARGGLPGGAVIDVGVGDEPGRVLLADRRRVDGRAAAYVCRGFVCAAPTSDPDVLAEQVRGRNVIPG